MHPYRRGAQSWPPARWPPSPSSWKKNRQAKSVAGERAEAQSHGAPAPSQTETSTATPPAYPSLIRVCVCVCALVGVPVTFNLFPVSCPSSSSLRRAPPTCLHWRTHIHVHIRNATLRHSCTHTHTQLAMTTTSAEDFSNLFSAPPFPRFPDLAAVPPLPSPSALVGPVPRRSFFSPLPLPSSTL